MGKASKVLHPTEAQRPAHGNEGTKAFLNIDASVASKRSWRGYENKKKKSTANKRAAIAGARIQNAVEQNTHHEELHPRKRNLSENA